MSRETPLDGIMAEFTGAADLQSALRQLASAGYRQFDSFSPYPLPDDPETPSGVEGHAIPLAGFIAGILGCAAAFGIQWYANARDFPLNVGARPLLSFPAWVPIGFEITILFASGALFVALWARTRLPRLWHPVFEVDGFERATIDRFWVAVASDDPAYDRVKTAEVLRSAGALRVAYIRAR